MNEEERNNEEIIEKTNNSKKIIGLAVLIMTLAISVTSATYAFFAFSASSGNTVMTGETAQLSGTVTIAPVSGIPASTNTGVMVPQYSAFNNKNALKQAIDHACIDDNKNIVCKVWKISFQNKSDAGMTTSATLTLTSATANLKWYTLKTGNNVASVPTVNATPGSSDYTYPSSLSAAYGNGKDVTTLGAHLAATLEPEKYRYWYVVTWIEETGINQYPADGDKTFNGEVTVNLTNSTGAVAGITSTFRGA